MNLASYQTLPVDTSLGTGICYNMYMQYHFFSSFCQNNLVQSEQIVNVSSLSFSSCI